MSLAFQLPLTRTVTLPDGTEVNISSAPESWWTTPNASGFIDPTVIAPDPKNPRRSMNPARLAELRASIVARGVRQSLIVTPRSHAPWATVDPVHKGAFFIAVSGHRRRNEAIAAELGAVPVQVKMYSSEKEHRMDVSLLNKGQEDLSELEQGQEIVDLRALGWRIDDLVRAFGLQLPQLYGRIYLTQLHPDLQRLLDPELPRKQRLGVTVAGALGGLKPPTAQELEDAYETFCAGIPREGPLAPGDIDALSDDERRFLLQKVMLSVIQARSLSSDRAIELIMERKLKITASKGNAGRRTERYQPRKRRDAFLALLSAIEGSIVMDWASVELKKIFELASREEVEEILRRFKSATELLVRIQTQLTAIRGTKASTRPEVLALTRERRLLQVEEPAVVAKPSEARPVARQVHVVQRRAPNPQKAQTSETPPPAPRWVPPKPVTPIVPKGGSIFGSTPKPKSYTSAEITTTYLGPTGRLVTQPVSVPQYIDLWDKGLLRFQRDKTARPEHVPSREEALARL